MKKWVKDNWELFLIVLMALLLFHRALFSNQPLGLDAIGHLSKVSYIQEFTFANWDMSWYSGSLFLKMYPPFFYYIASLFSNVLLGSNLISFFSLLFTPIGIYLFLKYLTKDRIISLISALSFFTILSISYYWIATGNLPYFAALWTIPFSLYFLEKSIIEKDRKYFIFYSLVFLIGIITHVITGLLIGLFMIIRFIFEGVNFKNIKRMLFYGGIPVLLSSFWFLPFLYFSSSAGEYSGYVPKIIQLFGLNDFVAWGFHAGGIGVLSYIFIFILPFLFLNIRKISKNLKYSLSLLVTLGFLLFGGLLRYYPYGVDPVRFILPFSIILIISIGISFKELQFLSKKWFLVLVIIMLIIGLVWNFSVTNQNFDRFTYNKEDSRYGIFKDIMNEGLPFIDKFENYRFGTSKFIFGEMMTYFMPNVPQTFGYQDAGMLNTPRYYDMRWNIWTSENIEDSIYWLDWFGIKYFEVDMREYMGKFSNDSRFKVVMNYSGYYEFMMYEYVDSKPIISLVDYSDDDIMGDIKEFKFERIHSDKIIITYENIDSNDIILFKEFYHKNWAAKELNSRNRLEVIEVGPGFMGVYPEENSSGIILYYQKSFIEYLGIFLSIIGIIMLMWIIRKNPNINY